MPLWSPYWHARSPSCSALQFSSKKLHNFPWSCSLPPHHTSCLVVPITFSRSFTPSYLQASLSPWWWSESFSQQRARDPDLEEPRCLSMNFFVWYCYHSWKERDLLLAAEGTLIFQRGIGSPARWCHIEAARKGSLPGSYYVAHEKEPHPNRRLSRSGYL